MASPPLPPAAAKLLDFTQPFDVELLEATVNAFYGAASNEEVGGGREGARRGAPSGPAARARGALARPAPHRGGTQ
jgi:hypothetical protein